MNWTFYQWLMHNRWRSDPIGDLARDVYLDRKWNKKAANIVEVQLCLPATACKDAVKALRAAWKEYDREDWKPPHRRRETPYEGSTPEENRLQLKTELKKMLGKEVIEENHEWIS